MNSFPKIAIIYLSFHCEPYMDDVVAALKKITYPKDKLVFVVVDNPHPQFGPSARYIQENVMPLSEKEIPRVVLLPQKENLGFAGGNNVGMQWALDHDYDYVFLHNEDGFAAANFLEPMIDAMEKDKTIGAVQPLVILYPDTDLINTSGNSFHYLGLGFCNNLRARRDTVALPAVAETAYASGAAIMMRADLLSQYGLWDNDFFLYHEDIEYCYRLKAAGYRIVVARDSLFYHKYSFSRNREKFYYIERNRYGVMLLFFKWPTLLLLLPMGIILDLGLLLFAWRSGWLESKINAYKYWLKRSSWRLWLSKRKKIQGWRKVNDRILMKEMVGRVIFEEKCINNPLLRYVGNPLMAAYWWVIKRIIFW